jgi:hypothetical protein
MLMSVGVYLLPGSSSEYCVVQFEKSSKFLLLVGAMASVPDENIQDSPFTKSAIESRYRKAFTVGARVPEGPDYMKIVKR